MQQRSMGSQIWRFAGPLVIQYLISGFVGACAAVYLLGGHFSELVAVAEKSTSNAEVSQMSAQLTMKVMEEAMKYTTEITTITALVTIPIMLIMFFRDRRKSITIGSPPLEKMSGWKYFGIVILGIAVCVALNNLVQLSSIAFLSDAYQEVSQSLYAAKFVVQLIGIGIIVPIAEELVYRGLMYKRLRETMKMGMAMFYSALVFALYHGNMVQAVYGFALGLLFSYLYEKYGSVKAPILAHIVVNLTSVILTKTDIYRWIFATPMRMGIVTVICAAVGAGMFVLVQKITRGNDNEDENAGVEKAAN